MAPPRVGSWCRYADHHQLRCAGRADVLNLLNDTAEEAVATDNFYSPTFGQPTIFIDPRRAHGQRAAESGTMSETAGIERDGAGRQKRGSGRRAREDPARDDQDQGHHRRSAARGRADSAGQLASPKLQSSVGGSHRRLRCRRSRRRTSSISIGKSNTRSIPTSRCSDVRQPATWSNQGFPSSNDTPRHRGTEPLCLFYVPLS